MKPSLAELTREYDAWLAVNPNVPHLSADEALFDLVSEWGEDDAPNPTPANIVAQIDWLHDFIERWQMTADLQTQGPQATAICDKWAAKLGYGFHPDTAGHAYDPPLSAAEAREYEDDILVLFGLDILDPYLYAVAALEEWAARQ